MVVPGKHVFVFCVCFSGKTGCSCQVPLNSPKMCSIRGPGSLRLHMGAIRGRFWTWTGGGKKRNQTGPFGNGSHAISGLGWCSRSSSQWLSGSVMLRPPLPQAWAGLEEDYELMGVDTPGQSLLPCGLALQLSCHQGSGQCSRHPFPQLWGVAFTPSHEDTTAPADDDRKCLHDCVDLCLKQV